MGYSYNSGIEKMKRDSLANGNFFFTKETMKFWGSRIESSLFENNTFVTSEDNFDRTRKLFTVRLYDWEEHSVTTIGQFQQFENAEDAIKFAKQYKG